MSFYLGTLGTWLCAAFFGWLVWTGLSSGRVAFIGPERKHAPLSYWGFLVILGAIALVLAAYGVLRLWALAVAQPV